MHEDSPFKRCIDIAELEDYASPAELERDKTWKRELLEKLTKMRAPQQRRALRELKAQGPVTVATVFNPDEWLKAAEVASRWGGDLVLLGQFILNCELPIFVDRTSDTACGIQKIHCPVEWIDEGRLQLDTCLLREEDVTCIEKIGSGFMIAPTLTSWLTAQEVCTWWQKKYFELEHFVKTEQLATYRWNPGYRGVGVVPPEHAVSSLDYSFLKTLEVGKFAALRAEELKPRRSKIENWLERLCIRLEAMEHWAQNPTTPTSTLAEQLGIDRVPRTVETWIGDLNPHPRRCRPLGSKDKTPRKRRASRQKLRD